MKDIFKESELTIYPLGIHAGRITVFLYHPDRLEAFFFQRKRAGIVA